MDHQTKRDLLTSSVGLLGVSLGMASTAHAAADSLKGAASVQGKERPVRSSVALEHANLAQLETEAHNASGPRSAILQAAASELRKAGASASDFGLHFDLSWRSAQAGGRPG